MPCAIPEIFMRFTEEGNSYRFSNLYSHKDMVINLVDKCDHPKEIYQHTTTPSPLLVRPPIVRISL